MSTKQQQNNLKKKKMRKRISTAAKCKKEINKQNGS